MPTSRAEAPSKLSLTYRIRESIEAQGLTPTQAAKAAGISQSIVSRFLAGRSIDLATADRLAEALGLRLVEVARRPKRPGK